MSNKLPWMKHDHDARNDEFIRTAEAEFGHFGYSGYFKMLEVLHEHGVGDNLCMNKVRFAKELRSTWPQASRFLALGRACGKLSWSEDGDRLNLTVNNFRKKQDKKNFKTESNGNELGPKPALEVDVDGERDKERRPDFLQKIKNLAFMKWSGRWTPGDLEDHRVMYGSVKGRRAIDTPLAEAQSMLKHFRMDPKTVASLKHVVQIKQQERVR